MPPESKTHTHSHMEGSPIMSVGNGTVINAYSDIELTCIYTVGNKSVPMFTICQVIIKYLSEYFIYNYPKIYAAKPCFLPSRCILNHDDSMIMSKDILHSFH